MLRQPLLPPSPHELSPHSSLSFSPCIAARVTIPRVTVNSPSSPSSPLCAGSKRSRPSSPITGLYVSQRPLKRARNGSSIRCKPLRLLIPMRPTSPVVGPSPPRTTTPSSPTPGLISSIQGVCLESTSPQRVPSPLLDVPSESPPSKRAPLSRNGSPPSLPPVLHLKRSNPKGLSLHLSLGASSFHNSTSTSSGRASVTPTPSTVCASPMSPNFPSQTPYTPGAPWTPAPSAPRPTGGSLGRSTMKSGRRPSLLTLITRPSLGEPPVPPTPGAVPHPYGRMRGHSRMRSAGTPLGSQHPEIDPRTSKSAYPSLRTFAAIDERPSHSSRSPENHTGSGAIGIPGMSPSTSLTSSSASATDSLASTPTTSPPLDEPDLAYPSLMLEPYEAGPIEIIPGVWLGAEDSLWHWNVWAKGASSVGLVNVAQEIENPLNEDDNQGDWATSAKSKPKVSISLHSKEADVQQPEVQYGHLRWSHGESGLAEIPAESTLDEIINADTCTEDTTSQWRLWEAIRWLEVRRRSGTPVLIHCQCGVSRSATLAIAYIMTLAAAGLVPEHLGHLRTMQDAYDYVKAKSPWIGPNVSLVFQLVEYARNLSSMLSNHVEQNGETWKTEWPALVDVESEDAWARRRRAFGEEVEASDRAEEEARRLDEVMAARAHGGRPEYNSL